MEFVDEKIAEIDADVADMHRGRRRYRRMHAMSLVLNVAVLAGEIYLAAALGLDGWGWLYVAAIVITVGTIAYVIRGYRRLKVIWADTDKAAAGVREHLVNLGQALDKHLADNPPPTS